MRDPHTHTRQIDALVAEKVMGWKPNTPCDGDTCSTCDEDAWYCYKCGHLGHWGESTEHDELPLHYSTDISAAWLVVGELNRHSITVEITAMVSRSDQSVKYIVYTFNNETCMPRDQAIEYAAPLAICLAALQALGVPIEEED